MMEWGLPCLSSGIGVGCWGRPWGLGHTPDLEADAASPSVQSLR